MDIRKIYDDLTQEERRALFLKLFDGHLVHALDDRLEDHEAPDNVRWEAVPRGAWSVEHCYVGADVQFAHLGAISGDAFGPGNEMDFRGKVVPVGIMVSLMVRHSCLQAVPFRAVFLGTRAETKRAFMPRNAS